MTKFKDIIITTAGQNALNKAVSDGNKITYTKASLSGTDLASKSVSDVQAITTLDSSKDSTLTLISTENGSVVLSATFDNARLTNDIKFNSVGWFAKTDQQAEFLFAVSRYDTEQVLGTIAPDSDVTQSITLQIGLAVSQGNVQVVETQAGVAMKADLNKAVINLTHQINLLSDTKNEVAEKADIDDVERELAKKANSLDVTNSIKQLTDTVNTKVDQSAVDSAVKPIGDALNAKANTADVDKELSTKITFVKCSSPQEAHDISSKPAKDGSVVLGIYDMDDEPSEAIVGDKKVTISVLYEALQDLQGQVTSLSALQRAIDAKANKTDVETDLGNKADESQITDLQNQIKELKDNQFEIQTFSDEDSGKTWENQKTGHRLAIIEN